MAKGGWGQSDLGEAEDRLRSQLALEGRVPVELEGPTPKIVPVMIVGDGTRPGMARSKDRRFFFGNGWTGLASGQLCTLVANEDIVIEQVVFSLAGAGTGALLQHYYAPVGAAALVGAPTVLNNPFVDRGLGERAPVSVANGAAALPAVQGVTEVLNGHSIVLPFEVMLLAGSQLGFRGVVASTGTFSVWGIGRTF